ncbi:MAG: hypothetical protein HY020_18845 [Burkholderiales bacterium]|nr:hypothetical protein [Burkholderiales bacterium]
MDTIEIERAVWEGASVFRPRNARAYADPRSQVHFEDAREFFARGRRRYDVVLSEPSNPWVSGVASLFTHEFYRGVKRSLKPGGLLVQWVHSYEISDALLAEMIAALLQEFPDSEIYTTNSLDLVILAPTSQLQAPNNAPWRSPELAAELRRVGLASAVDLAVRRIGGPAVLRTYVRLQKAPPHSDFFPTVSLFAPLQRFRGVHADLLQRLAADGMPLLPVLDCRPIRSPTPTISPSNFTPMLNRQQAAWAAERFSGRGPGQPRGEGLTRLVDALRLQRQPGSPLDADALLIYAANLAQAVLAHLPAADQQALWDPVAWRRAQPNLPPGVVEQLTLYDAVARQDWPVVDKSAERLLNGALDHAPPSLKEQVLVLGMLAGLAQHQPDAVLSREVRWGSLVPPGTLADARRFLSAWEDGREPVCVGRPATP